MIDIPNTYLALMLCFVFSQLMGLIDKHEAEAHGGSFTHLNSHRRCRVGFSSLVSLTREHELFMGPALCIHQGTPVLALHSRWACDKSKVGSYSWNNRILGRIPAEYSDGQYSDGQDQVEMVCRDWVFGIRQMSCYQN